MTNPKIEGYEEISEEEYDELMNRELPRAYTNILSTSTYCGKVYYFKPIKVYPQVFEGEINNYRVGETGNITIEKKNMMFDTLKEKDLLALEQAICLSKKLREKNDTIN